MNYKHKKTTRWPEFIRDIFWEASPQEVRKKQLGYFPFSWLFRTNPFNGFDITPT